MISDSEIIINNTERQSVRFQDKMCKKEFF